MGTRHSMYDGRRRARSRGYGRTKATAVVAKVAPGVGQLELGITFGSSVTQVKNDLAQATSQTGDLGLIGTSLTTEGCGGSSVLQAEQLPQPTAVDNREGDASAERDESGTAGSPFGLVACRSKRPTNPRPREHAPARALSGRLAPSRWGVAPRRPSRGSCRGRAERPWPRPRPPWISAG